MGRKLNSFFISCIIWGIFILIILFYLFLQTKNVNKNSTTESSSIIIEQENEQKYNSSIEEEIPEEKNQTKNLILNSSKEKENIYYYIDEEDRQIIKSIIAGEAKGESFKGKKLVAQCILNAMKLNNYDAETVRIEYQYSGWEPELEFTNPELWNEISLAVTEVFDKGLLETQEPILFFYAPKYSSGSWHENNLQYVLTEGGHKFFKLK